MLNFFSGLSPRGIERREKDAFNEGRKYGIEEGMAIGMSKHFYATSDLNDEENELLCRFLVDNNLVLCYDPYLGGFRVRKNDIINPQKEKVVYVVSDEYVQNGVIQPVLVSFVKSQLMKMDIDKMETDRRLNNMEFNIFNK